LQKPSTGFLVDPKAKLLVTAARVVGDSRHGDEKLLARHPELRVLYDAWTGGPGRGGAVR